MSKLVVFSNNVNMYTSTEFEIIKNILLEIGIYFDNRSHDKSERSIMKLKELFNVSNTDVVTFLPDENNIGMFREKFFREHTHSDYEIRFFIQGGGKFYIHIDDLVYIIHCVEGDVIGIPAFTKHWFDFCDDAGFTAARFFTNEISWVAKYTGDGIVNNYQNQ